MHSITPSTDFITTFAQQRQRLLYRAGTLVTSETPLPDSVPKLAQCLATSLEELKVAEEELFDQPLKHETSRAEQERRLSYFKALFHEAPTALLLTTTDGSIRAVNRAASALVMRDSYRLEGKPITALVPQESRMEFRRRLARVLEAQGVSSWCFTLLRQADAPVRVDAAITLLSAEITGARAFYWNLRAVPDPSSHEPLASR